jgi:hypothetical protein
VKFRKALCMQCFRPLNVLKHTEVSLWRPALLRRFFATESDQADDEAEAAEDDLEDVEGCSEDSWYKTIFI